MYSNLIVPVDHGNRNIKTENFVFTSGLSESDTRPPFGEYLFYQNKFYTLTDQRIPYMRDKTADERFFILTLFAIAKEAKRRELVTGRDLLKVQLPVGLPPKHYGALYEKFENYFCREEIISYSFSGQDYHVRIEDVMAFPQDYAAAITQYQKISGYHKVIVIDIGGFTLDYVMIREGSVDLSVCDSLEYGVIKLYNKITSRVNSEHDILLEDMDIDGILRGKETDYPGSVTDTVKGMTQSYADDLLGTLRERGIDLKSGCVVFVGGGSLLLREYLENSDKVGKSLFVTDIKANAKGYGLLYGMQKKAGAAYGKKE